MSAQTAERRTTLLQLQRRAREGEKLAMLTCYDASFARISDEAGVDMLLIVNSERLNFVENAEHLDLLIERIEGMRGGREFFNRA